MKFIYAAKTLSETKTDGVKLPEHLIVRLSWKDAMVKRPRAFDDDGHGPHRRISSRAHPERRFYGITHMKCRCEKKHKTVIPSDSDF